MSEVPTTGHAYDGIEEYDNPLPGWWKWMFVASILFSVLYTGYFHAGAPGRTLQAQYEQAYAANTRLQFAEIGDLTPNGENVAKFMVKKDWLKVGQVVFTTHCIQCHGRSGEGTVGPNLTDEHYKHVSDLNSLVRVVSQGAANKAMPAWSNRLHPNELVLVASYVATLRGTNATGGKPPEGREIPPWPEMEFEVEEDETKNQSEKESSP